MTARVLSDAQKRRMQEGRRRAIAERKRTRPDRLAAVERCLAELGARVDAMRNAGERIPWSLRDELRAVGGERLELKWSE